MKEKNLLASLAVFREFYDKESDIYTIISTFINSLIIENKLSSFSISEISGLLNSTYEFTIPYAVVKTSLKKLDYLTKTDNTYVVNSSKVPQQELSTRIKNIESGNQNMFNDLCSYVSKKKERKLTEIEQKNLTHNFCNYLLDESNGDEYFEYISSFIILNKENEDFVHQLSTIREGVILYSGIQYTNDFNDFGNWKRELTIILDTEILFHIAGFNGEVHQKIADDFLKFVFEINGRNKDGKLIKLRYFTEATNEVENFFSKAKHILEGKDQVNPRVTAMVELLNGCSSAGDLLEKKSDFYTLLRSKTIEEFNGIIDVTATENYEFNIIQEGLSEELNEILNTDSSEQILEILNKVSILRKNNNEENFENVRYILLSGNSKMLKASFNPKVNERFRIPLTTNLNFIINRFWFKLNKGFSQKDFPTSFNIITKSQIILSKILNENIGEKYLELQTRFKNGEITKEQAVNRIKDLRISAKKPEDIQQEISEEVLDFITIDSLDDYIEKQNHYKEKSKKFDKISQKLDDQTQISTTLKEQLLQSKKLRINEKKENISDYEDDLLRAKRFADRKFNQLRIFVLVLIILAYGVLIGAIFYYGWEKMEKITYILAIPFTLLGLSLRIFQKKLNLDSFYASIKNFYTNKKMKTISKFSEKEINKFRLEIMSLEEEIREIM